MVGGGVAAGEGCLVLFNSGADPFGSSLESEGKLPSFPGM